MFNPKRFLYVVVLAVLLVGFMSLPAVAAVSDERPVADVMVGSSGINFLPKVNYGQLEITVARADGTIFSKTFEPGGMPYLDLSSIFNGISYDGIYNFELRVIPRESSGVRSNVETAGLLKEGVKPPRAVTQTGSFLVQNGAIVPPSGAQEELSRTMDVLHYDDVIITGSLCVGFDCVNGESFGYCTQKYKENNLQVCFEDTSTGTFPTNDWKIQINDTTSGGASYFTIWDTDAGVRPFTIEAGAPAHSLYVEDYGRVGLGTSIPYVELHIVDGDSPTIRLDQDGSSGWTAQRWDLCGNETNFFVRDVTNGSKLCFRIQPNTPSNTLCLKSDGNVGIGTWSPAYSLEVEKTGENSLIVAGRTDGATTKMGATTNQGQFGTISDHPLKLVTNNTTRMSVNSDNSLTMTSGATCTAGGVWTSVSSRDAKENIKDLSADEAIEALGGLNPVTFNYKAEKEEQYVGFIAEDVPELVASKDRKHLTPMDVVGVLTKVLQEQQKIVGEQQDAIREQQKSITELKRRIVELEKR